MLGELRLSRRNERRLLRRGAVEAPDPVYRTMRWAYPGAFVAMAIEGAIVGPAPVAMVVTGAVVFVVAKGLKAWAIASLARRWTYRVIVEPGAPLVTSGPYRFVRHPNYAAVLGELVAMALLTGARITGPLGIVGFALLLGRRIGAEESALQIGRRVS
jgi:methyltransferase